MAYTEIQSRNGKKYYYRVKSVKKDNKVSKIRKYLGADLKRDVIKKLEKKADKTINKSLNSLLTKEEVNKLNIIKNNYKKEPEKSFNNRYEAFLAQFTYDSNAIEGNTLSLQETSIILFDNITPKGKTLREINEVLNHKKAFDFILSYKKNIDKKFICEIQKIIVQNTLRRDLENQIGKYRDIQVYIRGANFIPPKPEQAQKDMSSLLRWHSLNKNKLHPLILAAYFHSAFESIHPFVDGNGRTGRLLMNFILHKNNFPMINIPNKLRLEYYDCLEKARLGNLRKFVKFLFDLISKSKIYI